MQSHTQPPLAHNSEANTCHIPNLTGARYYAALAVFLMHLGEQFNWPSWAKPAVDAGGLGVIFFFVLSGYVLALNYSGRFNTWRDLRTEMREYSIRRFARIYPLYIGVLLVLLLVGLINDTAKSSNFFIYSWLAHALAIQAWLPRLDVQQAWNAPGWSVSCELIFYLALPALLIIQKMLRLRTILLAFALYALIVPLVLIWLAQQFIFPNQDMLGSAWVIRLPLLGFIAFAAGALAGTHHKSINRLAFGSPIWPCLVLLGFIYFLENILQLQFYLRIIVAIGIYTPIFLWLTCTLIADRPISNYVFGNPLICMLGESSYALYLIHWMFLPLAPQMITQWGHHYALLIAVAGITILSVIIHRCFESPIRSAINRYAIRVKPSK